MTTLFTHALSDRFRHAAWAELAGDPLEAALIPWAVETTRRQAEAFPAVRREVISIAQDRADGGRAQDVKLDEKSMEAQIKHFAERVRDSLAPAAAKPAGAGNADARVQE